MADSVNVFLEGIGNQSNRTYFKAGDNRPIDIEAPCYLYSSGVFPKQTLSEDTLERYDEILEGETTNTGLKEVIDSILIPYNISALKLILNMEYYNDPFPIDLVDNHKHIAPSLIAIKKEKIVPRMYPAWFVAAFPDVLHWILTAKGEKLLSIKRELQSIEKNQDLLQNGKPTSAFFIHLIEFYIFKTRESLVCKNHLPK